MYDRYGIPISSYSDEAADFATLAARAQQIGQGMIKEVVSKTIAEQGGTLPSGAKVTTTPAPVTSGISTPLLIVGGAAIVGLLAFLFLRKKK
jgi:LPXTG-motif cell wall-anchored protein